MRTLISRLHRKASQDPNDLSLSQLALPILLENLLRTSVGLVNVAFLSRISDSLVSAISIANQYISLCQVIATAISAGTMVSINQAVGMRNLKRVNSMSTVAVTVNSALGLLFGSFFLLFSRTLLSIMEVEPIAYDAAYTYLRIVGGGMVFQCVQIVLSSLLRSMGRPKLPLVINLCVNAINLIGCALVVFSPEGAAMDPALGVALSNLISQAFGLLLALMVLRKTSVKINLHYLHPFPWKDLKLALSVGIPSGANNIAYGSSQLATTAIISHTGASMIAAKVYASNLIHYVMQIGSAFGQAAVILIGYRIGAGLYEETMRLRRNVTRLAIASNVICSLILMSVRYPLLRMFTQDEQIIAIAAGIIVLDIFVEVGRALNNTLAGSLQAVGDVLFQLVVNQLSGWLISVGLSYAFGIICGWGLQGVWLAFTLDELTRGLILLLRWRRQKWLPRCMARREQVAARSGI